MLSYYCLNCILNAESKTPKVARRKNGRIIILSNSAVCNSKKSKFIKHQEVSGLLASLGIKTLFSQLPLAGLLLF